jgi:hypothetical protein
METHDLVFSVNEDNIMSAGFNINSLLLKEELDKNFKNYMVPIGLAYKETKENNDYISDVIDSEVIGSDLYDKLVDIATQTKNKKSRKNVPKKNNKTNKHKR